MTAINDNTDSILDTAGAIVKAAESDYFAKVHALASDIRANILVPMCNRLGLSYRCPGVRFWFTDKDGRLCIDSEHHKAASPEIAKLLSVLYTEAGEISWLGSYIEEYDSTTPRRMPNELSSHDSAVWGTCYVSGVTVEPGTGCTIRIHDGGSLLLPHGDAGADLHPGADLGCWTVSASCLDQVPMAVRHPPMEKSDL